MKHKMNWIALLDYAFFISWLIIFMVSTAVSHWLCIPNLFVMFYGIIRLLMLLEERERLRREKG